DRRHRPRAGRAAALTRSGTGGAGGADRIVAAMQRVAMLSVHTSPLAQPGTGDGGGMNVYVRSLASALARAGVEVDVLTRAEDPGQPEVVLVEPGLRVLHIEAGPRSPVARHLLP